MLERPATSPAGATLAPPDEHPLGERRARHSLRTGKRPWNVYAELVEDAGSAITVLEEERDPTLFDTQPDELQATERQIAEWQDSGMRLLTILDDDYPENLRAVHDRPPLIFVAGRLEHGRTNDRSP